MIQTVRLELKPGVPTPLPKIDPKSKVYVKVATGGSTYIGGANVNAENGFPVESNPAFLIPSMDYDQLYLFTAKQPGDVAYLFIWH